ncbi:MAG: hypothetical protein CR988_02375 [Treponema sp.]|nr:MAG: hypothetical protein CR988_02375 [Treponema sp.]
MIFNEELIKKIRTLLDEKIPDGGMEKDTNFSDFDIASELQNATSENHALYILWTKKAGFAQKNAGTIKRIQAGGELIEEYTAKDFIDLCLTTAKGYKDLWEAEKKEEQNNSFCIYQNKDGGIWG